MEKIILSYHDCCLYSSDLSILENSTAWLNDRIISLYFEYLKYEIYQNSDILFIGPEVTQAIKMIENADEVNKFILEPIQASHKSHILFAINNNDRDNEIGGTHWSLCVLSKEDNTLFHFDSLQYSNLHACNTIYNIIKNCFGLPHIELKNVECLQQSNSYDCGIFVLCHSDLVCKTIIKSESLNDVKKLEHSLVTRKRSELLEIISIMKK